MVHAELEPLLERYRRRDRQALSRLLSLVARGTLLGEIVAGIPARESATRVVAVTGSAGVGKSTLVGKLIELLRRQGLSVAVLACDPQSPLSGGALLGDRFRMPSLLDDAVFIRSLAAAGGQGAVAEHLDAMLRLLEGFGFDVVLIETVGAGQGDTAVCALSDVVVLLLQPETGDDLQWEKAGLLEVSDVVAIHKADLPGADSAEAQVRAALGLSPAGQAVPIVRVSSRNGTGLDALWHAIAGLPLRRRDDDQGGHELLRLSQDMLATRFAQAESSQAVRGLLAAWRQGNRSDDEAAGDLLRLLSEHSL